MGLKSGLDKMEAERINEYKRRETQLIEKFITLFFV